MTRMTHELVDFLFRTSIDQTALQILFQSCNQVVQLGTNGLQRSLDLYPLGRNILGLGREFETGQQLLEGSSRGGGVVFQSDQTVLRDSRHMSLQVGVNGASGLQESSATVNQHAVLTYLLLNISRILGDNLVLRNNLFPNLVGNTFLGKQRGNLIGTRVMRHRRLARVRSKLGR